MNWERFLRMAFYIGFVAVLIVFAYGLWVMTVD